MDKISEEELKSLSTALKNARWIKSAHGMYEASFEGWHMALIFDEDKGYGSATNLDLGLQVEIPSWIVDKVMERLQKLN